LSVLELIIKARKEGITFTVDGDRIRCKLPKPAPIRIKPLVDEIRERRDEVIEALKAEVAAAPVFTPLTPEQIAEIDSDNVQAVLIASTVLGADIWLAFRDDFDPGDGLAVFYADELEFLRDKSPQTLREIHKVKLAFGGGRVRQ
jgi:hypothetical protein